MAISPLRLSFTTTDGKIFDDQKEAVRHQRRLDATGEFANGLISTFGLEEAVAYNVAGYVGQNLELVFRMLGKVYRTPKDEAAGSENAGETGGGTSDDQTPA